MRTFLYSILCLRWKHLAAYESWDGLQLTPVTLSAGRKQVKGLKTDKVHFCWILALSNVRPPDNHMT